MFKELWNRFMQLPIHIGFGIIFAVLTFFFVSILAIAGVGAASMPFGMCLASVALWAFLRYARYCRERREKEIGL